MPEIFVIGFSTTHLPCAMLLYAGGAHSIIVGSQRIPPYVELIPLTPLYIIRIVFINYIACQREKDAW